MSADPYVAPQSRDQRSGVRGTLVAVAVLLGVLMLALSWGFLQYNRAIEAARHAEAEARLAREFAERQRVRSEQRQQEREIFRGTRDAEAE